MTSAWTSIFLVSTSQILPKLRHPPDVTLLLPGLAVDEEQERNFVSMSSIATEPRGQKLCGLPDWKSVESCSMALILLETHKRRTKSLELHSLPDN